jgi:hypothetical protein
MNNKISKLKLEIFPKTIVFAVVIICSILLGSCEKVIDVNYKEAEKKYVVEGEVSNITASGNTVKISQTKKFEDANAFTGISGATVTIQVNNGIIYTLPEVSTGIYKTTAFTGVPGSEYKLTVSVNGNTFSAISKMPSQVVSLDTVTVVDLAFGGSSKTIQPDYLDPVGLGNSYRFIQYVNGVQLKKVFVQNDELSDGIRVTRPLLNQDSDLKSGNTVKVDMLCIDENIYKYWYSLDQAATGSSSATPANPITNITGGALGYFSAYSITSKTTIVP